MNVIFLLYNIKSINAENRRNAISKALSQRTAVYSLIIEFNCETLRKTALNVPSEQSQLTTAQPPEGCSTGLHGVRL